jgi:beta-lactamase regulating signal transducer with metallopeptidase domain
MNAPINWLIANATWGAAGLLVWSWQAMALLALVWLALKICRMKSPALRHQVWLFGLGAVAMLPLSSIAIQRFPSLQSASPILNSVIEAPSVIIDFAPQAPVQTLSETAPEKASAVFPTTPPVKPAGKNPIVRPLLFAAWMIGALIALARVMKNHIGARRALKRARAIRPADLGCDESMVSMTGVLMTSKVRLWLSTEIHSPILFGVFRPIVLLPADIADWTMPAERAAMIQHELAHVERRDPLINLFQTALSVIFFFHPLVRYACRQLILEREMACDDRVVASGVAAEVYAAGILKAAERSVIAVGSPGGAHQLALFSAKQILERRLEMILNTNRARMIVHQWRYLVLPIALIAAAGFLLIPRYSAKNSSSNSPATNSLKPAIGSPVKATYSAQEQELIDMIQQVAEAIPQQWDYRYFRAGLPGERLVLDDFRLYDKRSSLTIIPPHPKEIPGAPDPHYSIPKVEVGAFEVSIDGDSAVIDFIATLHLNVPGQDKEALETDPYRVKLVKVDGQWQADRRNRMPWVGAMFWPPPPPRPATWVQGPWAEAQRTTHGMGIVNNGATQFSITVQSSSTFYDSDYDSEAQKEYCCLVQGAVVKLGDLELRAEKGFHLLNRDGVNPYPGIEKIQLKDQFELQWGEQTYYGLGSVTATYHQQNKRLGLGGFPETILYRTPDRTGEAITLQQLAQELRNQALRKN